MSTFDLNGSPVPRLGFGTWELTGEEAYRSVRDALDLGYRHVDTAQIYGNEEEVGRAIADSDVDRSELFLTTKVWRGRARREEAVASMEESLRKLQVDHVDLILIHWPNPDVEVAEVISGLNDIKEKGWSRHIGVSNYPSDMLREALEHGPVVTNQVEYHPYLDQSAVLEVIREHDLFLTAYSPLAHGDVVKDDTLSGIGDRHGVSGAQVALRWLIDQDNVVAIPRSSSRDHIADNFQLDFSLDDEDRAKIDELPKDRRLIDPFNVAWD